MIIWCISAAVLTCASHYRAHVLHLRKILFAVGPPSPRQLMSLHAFPETYTFSRYIQPISHAATVTTRLVFQRRDLKSSLCYSCACAGWGELEQGYQAQGAGCVEPARAVDAGQVAGALHRLLLSRLLHRPPGCALLSCLQHLLT